MSICAATNMTITVCVYIRWLWGLFQVFQQDDVLRVLLDKLGDVTRATQVWKSLLGLAESESLLKDGWMSS